MAQSPLQLKRYVFLRSLVEANQDYAKFAMEASDKLQEPDCVLSLDISVGKDEKQPYQYQIGLRIRDLTSKVGPLPYKVDIDMVGVFTVDEAFRPPDLDRIVQVNGASILFGAAREQVLMLTGRGPFGPFMLPTIHLQGEIPKPEAESADSS